MRPLDKEVLEQYSDRLARVRLIQEHREKKQRRLNKLNEKGYTVADSVACGRKGRKPLQTVKIFGTPYPEISKAKAELKKQDFILAREEQGLLEDTTRVEEYISGIADAEIRNLLTLYYVEDLNWVQVAHRMNYLYPKRKGSYTESSCRQKHDRFLEKN